MAASPRKLTRRRVLGGIVVLLLVALALSWTTVARHIAALVYNLGDVAGTWDCDATASQDGRPDPTKYGCFVPVPGHNILAYDSPGTDQPLTFLMGAQADDPDAPGYDPDASDDESPPHRVTIRPFWIQRAEVAVYQYRWCVRLGPCLPEDVRTGGYFNYDAPDRLLYPVNGITWDGARRYCESIGGRLPTEAEWEYVARGGPLGTRYPWGDAEPTCGHAVMGGGPAGQCGFANTEATGYYPERGPDYTHSTVSMAGNVWEWVADWYDPDYYERSPAISPTGPAQGEGRVQRGGGWGDSNPVVLRGAFRAQLEPDMQLEDLGFRCAADTVDHVHDATEAWMQRYGWHTLAAARLKRVDKGPARCGQSPPAGVRLAGSSPSPGSPTPEIPDREPS